MNSFTKDERMSSRKLISLLFTTKQSLIEYPFRFVWLEVDDLGTEFPCQICISVSKKHFKRANKRNLIKRRIREIFRQNKADLYGFLTQNQLKLALGVVYMSSKEHKFSFLEEHLKLGMGNIINEILAKSNPIEST
jgi:ribonuclease P protein component